MTDKEVKDWTTLEERSIQSMMIPLTGVSEDGSVYGTITKEMREEVNLDELLSESSEVKAYGKIYFME